MPKLDRFEQVCFGQEGGSEKGGRGGEGQSEQTPLMVMGWQTCPQAMRVELYFDCPSKL